MNDEEVVKRVLDGDVDAFEEIIKKYEKKIFGLVHNMIKNDNEVEDVAQEIFIKVYRNLGKFKGDSLLSTWIYKIATNACLDYVKKKKDVVYIEEKIKTEDGEIDFQLPSNDKLQDEIYEQKELKEKLEKCINRLPDKQRAMIVLRDVKGLSYEEISQILDLKLGTVKSQINRARLKLKDLLEKDGTFVEYIESNK